MLDIIMRNKLKFFCSENPEFNYFDTIYFVEDHITKKQYLLRRELSHEEKIEEILDAMAFLSSKKKRRKK